MKFWLFSLILICFGVLSSSRSSPQQVDKFSYVVDALTRPYSNAFNRIRAKTETGYKHLQSIITSGLTGSDTAQDTNFDSLKLQKIIRSSNINDMESPVIDEEEMSGSSRLLQSNCRRGSEVSTDVNIYTCNGKEVARADYDAVDGVGCSISIETKTLCYCPYDFYGDKCDKTNEFSCEIERISHPADCQSTDSYAYVYSYSGVPPCHTVKAGETVVFKTKAICSPLNSQYNFEGVKPDIYQVRQQPTAPTTFAYAIDTDRVRISDQPAQVVQRVAFTNWKKMSDDSLTYYTVLTPSQIAGIDEITTNIPFEYALTQAAVAGRYYFELAISTNGIPKFATRGYNGGYFEQAGYKEPAPASKPGKVLVIVLPVLGAVVLIGLIVGYKLYQRRKEQRDKKNIDSAPLVSDE